MRPCQRLSTVLASIHNHHPYERGSAEGILVSSIKRLVIGILLTVGLALALYFTIITLFKARYLQVPSAKKVLAILSTLSLVLLGTAISGIVAYETIKKG